MALSLDMKTTKVGIPVNGAYARIMRFSGDKSSIRLDVSIFASKEAREENSTPIDGGSYMIPYADGMAAWYDALKALPYFAGAVDC